MLLATCLKAVWRTDTALRLRDGGRALNPDGRHLALDPASRAALGLALRLRELIASPLAAPAAALAPPQAAAAIPGPPVPSAPGGADPALLALTVGPAAWEPLLRDALAWGATDVLRLWHPGWPAARDEELDGSAETTRLHALAAAAALHPRTPALVLVGGRSLDAGHACFGAFLAHGLGAAYAHRVTEVEPIPGGWRVVAELERGYAQRMELPSPAVLSIAAHVAGPPEPALPAFLRSRTAPIALAAPDLGDATSSAPAAPAARAATTVRAPVPRVKRYTVPAAGLSAEERIRALVTLPTGSGGTIVGAGQTPDAQAAAILELLRAKGHVLA